MLETYRQLHHWNQTQFLYRDGIPYCAKSTYARMKHQEETLSDFHYLNLLELYGFYYQEYSILDQFTHDLDALYHGLCFYQQDTCIQILNRILQKITHYYRNIEAVLLAIFFERLRDYFLHLQYLNEFEICGFLMMRELYKNNMQMRDLFTFYCMYSSSRISKALERDLYLKHPELYECTYLPAMIHALDFDFHNHRYEEGIYKSILVKKEAWNTNNIVMQFEYYNSMMTYYIRCQNEKIEITLKKLIQLVSTPNFPRNKQLQFLSNYAKFTIFQKNYKKALNILYTYMKAIDIETTDMRKGIFNDVAICESQLGLPYSDFLNHPTYEPQFPSKSDYYLFQYLMHKHEMDKYQRIKFIKNKIVKYLMKGDNDYTKFLINQELDLIPMNDSKADVLKQTTV